MEYKIIMNNGNEYHYETFKNNSDFLEWTSSQQFLKVHKYATDIFGKAVRLTVFLSTKNISEIIKE